MSRTRPITPGEFRKLLRKLDRKTALAALISADTGLRVSDVLSLRCADLAREMTVIEQKTGKSRRVKLKPQTLKFAQDYAKHGHEYLINCNRTTVYRHVRKAAQELGYTHVSMHSIRKMYARQYCKAHGLLKTQREMQHDYLSTTMLYVLNPEDVERMLDNDG